MMGLLLPGAIFLPGVSRISFWGQYVLLRLKNIRVTIFLHLGTPPKFFLLFLCLFSLFTLGACASLPKVEEVQAPSQTKTPPTIVGPQGELSPKKSQALMKRLERKAGVTDILQQDITLMESIGGGPLVIGNKATLLIDGPATYAAMMKAIQEAKDHINFEAYIFSEDETGRAFADLLLQKQSEGVQVNLIYDSVGCKDVPPPFFQHLRDGGVRTLEFNPLNPLEARGKWLLIERDHRKMLIVDGRVAFTGGVNISEVYSKGSLTRYLEGSSRGYLGGNARAPWRDTHVQIEGPAVAEFQKLFLDTWAREKGPELPPRNYFPALKKEGNDLVRVVGSRPSKNNPTTYLMYLSAIAHAENFIHLTSSYFVPNNAMIKALREAAQRGVDVKIILPGTTDLGFIFFAGRSFYTPLLKAGVKLYERRGAVLHAKTAVIDGVWSTIGSTNLDLWSFMRNDEVNTVILGQDFAAEMEAMFTKDVENSNPVLLEEWKERPLSERLKEWFTRLFRYWL